MRKVTTKKSVKKVVKSAEKIIFQVGRTVFIRTVTHHIVGEILAVGETEIVLKTGTVMWIADSGRFTQALKTGVFYETEVYDVETPFIGRGAIVDGGIFPKNVKIMVVQK